MPDLPEIDLVRTRSASFGTAVGDDVAAAPAGEIAERAGAAEVATGLTLRR